MNWENKVYKVKISYKHGRAIPVSYEVSVDEALGGRPYSNTTSHCYIKPCLLGADKRTTRTVSGLSYQFVKRDIKNKIDNYIKLI